MVTEVTRVLIVDDEADVCNFLRRLLSRKGYAVTTATNEAETLAALHGAAYQVAMVDLKLPDTDGLTLLRQIKAHHPACEVIIMTGFSTIKTAVSAMQMGAYEYVEKPFDDIAEIEVLIHKAARHGSLGAGAGGDEEWAGVARAVGLQVGRSQAMRRLVSLAYKIANKNINVLIQGKTGSGKEVLARFIHAASSRADQAFFPINCAALPENMLESELFGHERGSFTGAGSLRRGIFELAHRGTLFLDEIGDAGPAIQVKLLRVLETGEFMRVGGEKPIRGNVRLISASNVDLWEAVGKKTFREDLYYRLNVVRLELPSLAERREDIPALAEYFVRQNNPDLTLAPAVVSLLQEHSWPGNIRELVNVLRRAAALCSGPTILPKHLGHFLAAADPGEGAAHPDPLPTSGANILAWLGGAEGLGRRSRQDLEQLLGQVEDLAGILYQLTGRSSASPNAPLDLHANEREAVRAALERNHWNISAAARQLGIGRNTLHRKINKYGLR
ncbi:sigma-54-dependent transcriptional regulator [Geoalkalibacter halelectricus]|uniref:Sigma-54 dependent transcriptional regulator n=1 Tax=Geoalkalibacter halelectricus TaxID=2847045 RepID=A0ABY5ZJY0_9BACT|nr:sigma-54 dependent transcriptional regulator [Geoalkalibacter halelectricus]UWZ78923.1 sigma-54 dependent transcriptional regulator [Geoalkalibacter halelectricus]